MEEARWSDGSLVITVKNIRGPHKSWSVDIVWATFSFLRRVQFTGDSHDPEASYSLHTSPQYLRDTAHGTIQPINTWYMNFQKKKTSPPLMYNPPPMHFVLVIPQSRLQQSTKKTKLHGLSQRANYTDRATAACRWSDCQLVRIEGATLSAWRIPTAVFLGFLDRSRYFSIK
jgi:hypothetical protein